MTYNLYALAEELGEDIETIRRWPEAKVAGWLAYFKAKELRRKQK